MSNSVSSSGAKALDSFSVPARPKGGGAAVRLSPSALAPATLTANDIATLSKAREARWRPGLANQPLHSEIFASSQDGSGAGLAFALAHDALRSANEEGNPLAAVEDCRQVLWVQDARAIQRGGRPYRHGLPDDLQDRLIHVAANTPEDALFTLEEGLKCRDLACVIGEISGNPRVLDFTASRRLSLTAEKHGVALWLVRLDAEPDLSSARMRWRVAPAPSLRSRWNADAPGFPTWEAELFRARSHAPGKWILNDDDGRLTASRPAGHVFPKTAATPHPRHLVCPTVGRSLAACARA